MAQRHALQKTGSAVCFWCVRRPKFGSRKRGYGSTHTGQLPREIFRDQGVFLPLDELVPKHNSVHDQEFSDVTTQTKTTGSRFSGESGPFSTKMKPGPTLPTASGGAPAGVLPDGREGVAQCPSMLSVILGWQAIQVVEPPSDGSPSIDRSQSTLHLSTGHNPSTGHNLPYLSMHRDRSQSINGSPSA